MCCTAGILLRKCVAGVCSALIAKEEELNELDRGSGDGDCGSTLKAGVTGEKEPPTQSKLVLYTDHCALTAAIQEKLSCINFDEPQRTLLSLASTVGDSMGGSSGAVS